MFWNLDNAALSEVRFVNPAIYYSYAQSPVHICLCYSKLDYCVSCPTDTEYLGCPSLKHWHAIEFSYFNRLIFQLVVISILRRGKCLTYVFHGVTSTALIGRPEFEPQSDPPGETGVNLFTTSGVARVRKEFGKVVPNWWLRKSRQFRWADIEAIITTRKGITNDPWKSIKQVWFT